MHLFACAPGKLWPRLERLDSKRIIPVSPSDKPTSVWQAIESMNDDNWEELALQVFKVEPQYLTAEMVFDKIRETNTCSELRSPVRVWIDSQCYWSVDVYDKERKTI